METKISRSDFLNEVYNEIEHIRLNATKEEKDKLDFERFNPNDSYDCIYGQMTGFCRSNRAKELYKKSLGNLVHWELADERKVIPISEDYMDFTYLEAYIASMREEAGINKAILDYIKGNVQQLELK